MKGKKLLTGVLSAAMVFGTMAFPVFADGENGTAPDWENNEGKNVVAYGVGENNKDIYTATLTEALKAVYKSNPSDTVTIECRDGADVGTMTHGHVADSLIIKGNNAYVSAGERDLEFDTYMFDRTTGKQVTDNGEYLDKDITVKVENLNGIAAWGQRNTDHAVNLEFDNCQRMQRVYISGTVGTNNYKLTNCTFDGTTDENAKPVEGSGKTSVYSNAPGTIEVNNCTFNNVALGVNINNKSGGEQTISISGCKFTDCATDDNAADWRKFSAPIRLVTSGDDATINATIEGSTITGKNVGNGDILLGDGRDGEISTPNVKLNISGTAAEIQAQEQGKRETPTVKKVTAADSVVVGMPSVAKIGEINYATLADAITAAKDGDTVTLVNDVMESIKIDEGKAITFDLNGKILTNTDGKHTIENYGKLVVEDGSQNKTGKVDNITNGRISFVNYEGGVATLNGGSFDRSMENGKVGATDAGCNSCYTIKNWGIMTINENVSVNNNTDKQGGSSAIGNGYQNGAEFDKHTNVTSANVKLTINGGKFTGGLNTIKNDDWAILEVNGGVFKNNTQQCIMNWNKATITGGIFTGEPNAIYNGYDNDSMDKGILEITGGEFNGKIQVYDVNKKGKTSISGGTFNTDVSAYCADGFAGKKIGDVWVVDESASKVSLGFKATADARVYDIVVKAEDATEINRLNTADLTFNLTASDAANSSVVYTILPVDNITVTPDMENVNRYMFNFNGKDGITADTGAEVKIGQVQFDGYTTNGAKITFTADADKSLVTATTKSNNLVTYFGNGAFANSTAADRKIDGVEFAVPTKKLTVNIAMNNKVTDNVKAYQDMKVEIKGAKVAKTIDLGTDGTAQTANGGYTVTEELEQNIPYTVTVSGAGYRTARYTVNLNADKTLNFWNNVMDEAKVVEVNNEAYKKNVTFLAGDIVKDNKINIYDLSAVVSYFGTDNLVAEHPEYAKYDLNRDGVIDSKDVAYVLVSWGN